MKFCERPFTFAFLAEKGEVWPCPWMHYTIGNLYEQDLDEIWHSEAAEAARQTILDGSFKLCRKQSCPFLERDELPDLSEETLREKAVPAPIPMTISICNDHTCNIACTNCRTELYCAEGEEREKIDDVLVRLRPFANQAEQVSMNGGGEFLANPSFIRFLEDLRPEREDFRIVLESNGVLFDEKHWERFSHLGKYDMSVTITVNSLKREVYRYLTGGFDHLERVLDNLRFLSKLRREGAVNKLSLSFVVQETNFWEIPNYIRTFTQSEDFEIDEFSMKPLYRWWHMDEETYWRKNILNPLHPYHQAHLKILADDCWNNSKVYDWGCHNIREAVPSPFEQVKIYNRLLLDIFQNDKGLSPSEFLRACAKRAGAGRIGYYGKNEFSKKFVRMLRDAGVDVAFQLTWTVECDDGELPKVAKQELRPDMADMILVIDFFKGGYWFTDLPAIGFQGPVLSLEQFIEGTER